jgi:5-(carboxyamino)imidazole ribonucleotide synthase
MPDSPILPGSTIGILGSGQLGRMLTAAARQLGYRVHVYSPEGGSPAGQLADAETIGAYADADSVARFAQGVDVVTYEFENIPSASAAAAERCSRLRPDPQLLHITQHRLREKRWLRAHGFPVAEFREIVTPADLDAAVAELGCPCVLKTAGFGYDGKGQYKLRVPEDVAAAWAALGLSSSGRGGASSTPTEPVAVLEQWVSFELECSVVGARGAGGEVELFTPAENIHANHILDLSLAPARLAETTCLRALALARGVLEAFGAVGVMAIELFLARDGELLVNELAPRVHNSGHWTIEGAVTSQFEQHIRAVCGLPLGSAEQQQPAALANLLGDLWFAPDAAPRVPDWAALLAHPEVKLHLYGKAEPRHGRKMGHLTALSPTAEQALQRVCAAREALAAGSAGLV